LRPDHHKAICSVRLFPSSPPQNDMPSAPISALTLKIAICLLYILPRVSIFPPHSSVAPLHILMRVCVIPPLSSLSDMPCVRLSKDLSHTALTLTQWYALSAHFRQSVSYRPHPHPTPSPSPSPSPHPQGSPHEYCCSIRSIFSFDNINSRANCFHTRIHSSR
jgi:hypothetical protein